MISLVEDFNNIPLHDPFQYPDIMKLYSHIEEITEEDNRGFIIQRPLFSQSDLPDLLKIPKVKIQDFHWEEDFIYAVLLHHNNTLAIKHLGLIPSYILTEVRNKRCKLVLDNVLEGNSIDFLLEPLYRVIQELNLPAEQIYYVTNNLVAEKVHEKWLEENTVTSPITITSVMYNVHDVQRLKKVPLYKEIIIETPTEKVVPSEFLPALPPRVSIKDEIEYKKLNLENIKSFLKVNRTNREERNLFMLFMNKHNLFEKSLVSFPDYPSFYQYHERFDYLLEEDNVKSLLKKLPFDLDESDRSNHGPAGFGLNEFDADLPFNPVHYRNTFISIVMCAFPFDENGCHLHSSTFNPMYCGHPIIQFGPRGHMQELRNRGFKTFNDWWDESYDEIEDTWDRFEAIMKLVLDLSKKSKEEMLEMYVDMKTTLQHNSNLINKYKGIKELKEVILKKRSLYSTTYAIIIPEKSDIQIAKNFKVFKGTVEQATLDIKKYELEQDILFAGVIIINSLKFLTIEGDKTKLINELVSKNKLTLKNIYLNKIYHHGIDSKCYAEDKIVYCSTWVLPFYSYLKRSNNSLYANCMRHRLHMVEFLNSQSSKFIL